MRLSNREIAEHLIKYSGGLKNIIGNETCMTRLHIQFKDKSLVDIEMIKKLEATLGVIEGETLQIIFGPGKVTNIGNEFSVLTNIPLENDTDLEEYKFHNSDNEINSPIKHKNTVQAFFKHIANIFLPILPGIAGAGLINGITKAINLSNGNAFVDLWWYSLIMTVGWALFAYLPIFVGMNAATEMKGTAILGGIGGALSVANTTMPLLLMENGNPILLPFSQSVYNPSAGGILAAAFTGMCFALIERSVRKYIPTVLDMFLTPLVTIILGGILSLVILQPLGSVVISGLYFVMDFVFTQWGPFGGFILSTFQLPLVSLGLHRVFTPIHAILNDPSGPTFGVNYLLPILMVAGGGQVGAALALLARTKNKQLKKTIVATIPAGILGVGEPLMYSVTLPLFRPFIAACLGSGFGGAIIVLLHVGAISQGVSGIMAPLIINPGSQTTYIAGLLAAYCGGFALTYFFGYSEDMIEKIFDK